MQLLDWNPRDAEFYKYHTWIMYIIAIMVGLQYCILKTP